MSVLTGDDRFEREYNESQKGEEPKNMCEVLDRIEKRGIQKGLTQGKVTDLKNLMETLKLTLDQAMNALKISMEEREKYEKMIRT